LKSSLYIILFSGTEEGKGDKGVRATLLTM
jgi:hypothetical protein